MIIATEDAIEKVKSSAIGCFSYGAALYHFLIQFTDQGIRNIKYATRRADIAKCEAEKIGSKFTVYWTFGKYDGLTVGSLGDVRTTTLKTFTKEEIG